MWCAIDQKWVYDWCKKIVENMTGIEPIKKKTKKRKTIPKKIRDSCWKEYGIKKGGKCWICQTKLEFDTFEAGHIISVAKGGGDNLENLRPICKGCNRSQGTKNMIQYIQELVFLQFY